MTITNNLIKKHTSVQEPLPRFRDGWLANVWYREKDRRAYENFAERVREMEYENRSLIQKECKETSGSLPCLGASLPQPDLEVFRQENGRMAGLRYAEERIKRVKIRSDKINDQIKAIDEVRDCCIKELKFNEEPKKMYAALKEIAAKIKAIDIGVRELVNALPETDQQKTNRKGNFSSWPSPPLDLEAGLDDIDKVSDENKNVLISELKKMDGLREKLIWHMKFLEIREKAALLAYGHELHALSLDLW